MPIRWSFLYTHYKWNETCHTKFMSSMKLSSEVLFLNGIDKEVDFYRNWNYFCFVFINSFYFWRVWWCSIRIGFFKFFFIKLHFFFVIPYFSPFNSCICYCFVVVFIFSFVVCLVLVDFRLHSFLFIFEVKQLFFRCASSTQLWERGCLFGFVHSQILWVISTSERHIIMNICMYAFLFKKTPSGGCLIYFSFELIWVFNLEANLALTNSIEYPLLMLHSVWILTRRLKSLQLWFFFEFF